MTADKSSDIASPTDCDDLDLEGLEALLSGMDGPAATDGGGRPAGGAGTGVPLTRADRIAMLKDRAASLERAHVFKPGQLVRWKAGCKNRKYPAYGEPVVVIEVLATPVLDGEKKGAGTPYFREPLTIVAGWIDSDGDLVCFHYDQRRFEPCQAPATA